MKPVGLKEPESGREFFAIVQLRAENNENTLYNLVGFQTNLTFGEQRELMKYIPGLENAEIERYGVMHRNTYIKSPGFLNRFQQVIKSENLYFAGQITGVEGYLESAASGICAGINASRMFLGKDMIDLPAETIMGALSGYISNYKGKSFQPMNANFGILPQLGEIIKNKKERKSALGERAVEAMEHYKKKII
jgi:methylenetetrahydrofolate--tRNA-(uracil-5-)-methyltransferase